MVAHFFKKIFNTVFLHKIYKQYDANGFWSALWYIWKNKDFPGI